MAIVEATPEATRQAVLGVLRRVRMRLTPPEAWLQGDFARSLAGTACHVSQSDASCWCLEGAISAEVLQVFDGHWLDVHRGVFTALIETVGLHGSGLTLAGWNDAPGRTHDEVLGVLTLTITRLEQATGAAA